MRCKNALVHEGTRTAVWCEYADRLTVLRLREKVVFLLPLSLTTEEEVTAAAVSTGDVAGV